MLMLYTTESNLMVFGGHRELFEELVSVASPVGKGEGQADHGQDLSNGDQQTSGLHLSPSRHQSNPYLTGGIGPALPEQLA